jgi:hypothetical protein
MEQSSDTIYEDCSIWLSFIMIHTVPNASGRGRIIIKIPSQITPVLNTCGVNINGSPTGTTCSITSSVVYITHSVTGSVQNANFTVELNFI